MQLDFYMRFIVQLGLKKIKSARTKAEKAIMAGMSKTASRDQTVGKTVRLGKAPFAV